MRRAVLDCPIDTVLASPPTRTFRTAYAFRKIRAKNTTDKRAISGPIMLPNHRITLDTTSKSNTFKRLQCRIIYRVVSRVTKGVSMVTRPVARATETKNGMRTIEEERFRTITLGLSVLTKTTKTGAGLTLQINFNTLANSTITVKLTKRLTGTRATMATKAKAIPTTITITRRT